MAPEKEGSSSSMRETHQGQATGVMAETEKLDEQAFEPQRPQKSSTSESKKGPEGGYDDTPIARREVRRPHTRKAEQPLNADSPDTRSSSPSTAPATCRWPTSTRYPPTPSSWLS